MYARETTIATTLSDKRLLTVDEFCAYAGIGRTSARKIADSTGCKFKIGQRMFIDRVKFDRYCDENSEIETDAHA